MGTFLGFGEKNVFLGNETRGLKSPPKTLIYLMGESPKERKKSVKAFVLGENNFLKKPLKQKPPPKKSCP